MAEELKETTNLDDILGGDIDLNAIESSITGEDMDRMLGIVKKTPEEEKILADELKAKEEEATKKLEEEKDKPELDTEGNPIVVEEEEASSLYAEIDELTGFPVEGEFEDTTEGLAKRTLAVAEKVLEQEFGNFFEQHPDIAEYLRYKELGGNIETYLETIYPKLDYSKLEITEEDINTQKTIVAQGLRKQGYPENKISEKIKRYENSGVLLQEANDTKETLVNDQKAEKESIIERQAYLNNLEVEKQNKIANDIEDSIINNTTFAGIVIPESDKKKFYDHITKPVTKEGYTQYYMDTQNDTIEDRLALLYLRYKNFNLSDVVERKAKTMEAKKVSALIKSSKETLKSKQPEVATENLKDIFND